MFYIDGDHNLVVKAPGFTPQPHPREVADVFETPLSFLMNPANHQRHERAYKGVLRAYYMPYNGRCAPAAGMLKSLYDRLYARRKPGEG
jgi:hypothetical protein